MPNLSAHLGIAQEVITRLNHPIIDRNQGACLLGSVSPDVRIITKTKRDETHFVNLDFDEVGQGLKGLFSTYPSLHRSADLTEATISFIIGYACHLLADESWIVDIYRPYFGALGIVEDKVEAGLMDRALQLELDSKEHERLGGTITLKSIFDDSEKDVFIDFISKETLTEWRTWIQNVLSWEFTWERLRFMSRRVNTNGDTTMEQHLQQIVDQFLNDIPKGLDRIYKFVPKYKIELFRNNCIDNVLNFAGEYLK
jgi:hypothetical protein